MSEINEILELCLAAYDRAAEEQFIKDGRVDCGSCGGAMLAYPARSALAKAMMAKGIGQNLSGPGVYLCKRSNLPTQHAEVEIRGIRAFMAMAEAHGFRPVKFWTYVD